MPIQLTSNTTLTDITNYLSSEGTNKEQELRSRNGSLYCKKTHASLPVKSRRRKHIKDAIQAVTNAAVREFPQYGGACTVDIQRKEIITRSDVDNLQGNLLYRSNLERSMKDFQSEILSKINFKTKLTDRNFFDVINNDTFKDNDIIVINKNGEIDKVSKPMLTLLDSQKAQEERALNKEKALHIFIACLCDTHGINGWFAFNSMKRYLNKSQNYLTKQEIKQIHDQLLHKPYILDQVGKLPRVIVENNINNIRDIHKQPKIQWPR
ncbi:hypothetical protein [Chromobacterium amazonense]|uniref:hypothetical protein n=1 Tax=Chromobacterium amazonense TaxID=1382803 RepID=UPI003F7AEF9B